MQKYVSLAENKYDEALSTLRPDLLFLPVGINIREERIQATMAEAHRLAALYGLYVVYIDACLKE